MHIRITVLITLCAFISNAQTVEKAVKIEGIPFPLWWEPAPVDFKVEKNKVTVKAGKETDLYSFVDGSYYVHSAPRLLFTPDSNFVFSARIKPQFLNTYDGGAMILYADNGNWAKALYEMHDDKTKGLGVSVVDDKHGDDSYHGEVAGDAVYVKIARSGNIFNFYQSADGKTWRLVRTFPFDKKSSYRIGFYAQSPKGESCTVEFSEILYKGVKFENFFTGE